MNYSRKQLYAFGETFGDSVTRKEGGRIIYGGGGGGGSSTPSTQTSITELPEWARGPAKDTLSKAAALTDINQNPYQTYGGDRVAGFSPMQTQAQRGAQNMQTSGMTGMAGNMAGAATMGALGTSYDPTQFQAGQFGQGDAQQYMSPYMQSVVDMQQKEAGRTADIATQGRNAQATGAGAFGGSRQAIMDAEAARNLATQKGGIQASGLQNAFQQAQQQYNADQARQMQAQQGTEQSRQYGAGLGLQGLQTALQGAGQMGQLGGQQFQQGMDINKLQSAYGGQEQALKQQGLDVSYQNFQNQQNYPYKQLGFMSDMIRGMPLGQQSTTQMYAAPTSAAQTAATVGMAGLGLSKFMADGGAVQSYAGGGGVDSQDNVDSILSKLSSQQLDQAIAAAQARGDVAQMQAAQSEKGFRASMERGIAGAVTPEMSKRMAGGGVVAFAKGGDAFEQSMQRLQAQPEYTPPTAAQSQESTKALLPGLQGLYGASKTDPYMEEVKAERAKRKGEDTGDRAMGSGLLQAAAAMAGAGNFTKGIGGAAAAFGTEVNKIKKENQEADRLLRASEIQLATAEQSRADGMVGKAADQQQKAESMAQAAAKMKQDTAEKEATIRGGIKQAQIQAAASGAAANKASDLDKQTKIRHAALLEGGAPNNAETLSKAAQMAASDLGRYSGEARVEAAGAKAGAAAALKSDAALEAALKSNGPYLKAMNKGDFEGASRIRELVRGVLDKQEGQGAGAPPNKAPKAGAPSGIPSGAISVLKKDPSLKADFDRKYGEGAAARVLGS